MPTIGAILNSLSKQAPPETKMDFDNVGLLAGDPEWDVSCVMLSLDITSAVIREAEQYGAGLIVSHHPIFFDLKSATPETEGGKHLLELLTRRIGAVCMHTNLDAADGGVNDALASALRLRDAHAVEPEHILRVGLLDKAMPMDDFLAEVKTALRCDGLRYTGNAPVWRVAVGGGSCGSMLTEVVKTGCDTFVTADIKHDVFLRASELGLNLIDAGHFCTENVVIPVLKNWLTRSFPDLRILISSHRAPERFYC